MTPRRTGGYGERPAGSLKEAQQQLVDAVGGLDRAAQIARIGRSQLARCTSAADEHQTVNMPMDVVDCLEEASGTRIVTEWMVSRRRAILVPLPDGRPEPWMQHLCGVGRETGKLFADANEALADGVMSAKEAGKVRRDTMRLASALGVFLSRLDAVIFGDGA